MGGLLGFSGIDIRRFINTESTAGKLTLFTGIDKGIVLVSILEVNMDGCGRTVRVFRYRY